MENKLLTIAIPAYNMEKYLHRCVDSMLELTIVDLLEILIVNDGSKDSTLDIARDFEKRFPQSVRVLDKPNGGWGTGVNLAMSEARGKYFKIVDADDWVDTAQFKIFVERLKTLDFDVVGSTFSYAYTDGSEKPEPLEKSIVGKSWKFSDLVEQHDYRHFMSLTVLTYRTSLLQQNKIKVADRYYADVNYYLLPLMYVKTAYFTDLNVYRYFYGRPDQSVNVNSMKAHMMDYIQMTENLLAYFEANSKDMSKTIQKMYLKDFRIYVGHCYYLLMSPTFGGTDEKNKAVLRDFDSKVKSFNAGLYKAIGDIAVKKHLPYVKIWRKTGINVLKLRTWISSLVPGRQG